LQKEKEIIMLNKIKKIVPLFLLSVSLVASTVASAEEQSGSTTKNGIKITYSLNCTFNVGSNDSATAQTKWAGKTGYKVKTMLYQSQNIADSYHLIGSALEKETAKVTGSIGGVWTFKSKHYYHKNKTSTSIAENQLLTEFTDW